MPMLNPYQANALAVSLRSLERLLFRIEALCADGDGEKYGLLVRQVNPLTSEQKAALMELCRQTSQTISLLAGRFGLQCEMEDVAQTARGHLVSVWATLEDTKASKLVRYGDVDTALGPMLDPEMDELIRIVNTMEKHLLPASTGG